MIDTENKFAFVEPPTATCVRHGCTLPVVVQGESKEGWLVRVPGPQRFNGLGVLWDRLVEPVLLPSQPNKRRRRGASMAQLGKRLGRGSPSGCHHDVTPELP
jgi:hypothetical protein